VQAAEAVAAQLNILDRQRLRGDGGAEGSDADRH
jgi:hypothetical protein